MILYKNVDICDLESILEKGILSIDDCKNNNWDDGKRAENSTSVVYLFSPTSEINSFTNYGSALLEVECDDVRENEILEPDPHKQKYKEWIVERVEPKNIRRIIIPKIFQPYIEIPENIPVTWCEIKADIYNHGYEECSQEMLEQFARTAPLMDTKWYNFFRGKDEKGEMLELFNIKYLY